MLFLIIKMTNSGRPTKYKPEYIDEVYKYIKTTGRLQTELPTVEGFADYIGVHRDSIYEWKKKHPLFSDTIKVILDKQKIQLMNDGLYGGREVNSSMAIFLLKVNHGMVETEKKILQGDPDRPLGVVMLPEKYDKNNTMAASSRPADGSAQKA